MHIEIRHARVVTTVAEAGSISKAAIVLGLPQPSLTAQLRRIEKAFGGELFIRSRSGITPTPLGERLIPLLVDLAARADAVIAEASALSSGVLRIGNAEWTPATLHQAIQGCLPYWEVQTETLAPMSGVQAVYRGALTAALVPSLEATAPLRVPESAFAKELIVREPVCVALPVGHELARRSVLSWPRLAGLTWVRHTRGHWLHDVEEHVFTDVGRIVPNVARHVGSQTEATNLVRDTGAAALVTPTGASKDVVLIPIDKAPRSHLLLVWRKESIHPSTQRRLVHTLRGYYCEYAAMMPDYWHWLTAHPAEFTELAAFLPRRQAAETWPMNVRVG
jgi:DNA-binding transcriptional LysR family regulator